MMARALLMIAWILALSPAGMPQINSAAEVGIDEKLGKQVAMDVVLKDEDGSDVTLRRLIDKPTILIFNYLRCPAVCPILISNMVEIVNQMQLEPGRDFRLVAVSFDPTDTPEMARQKKANYLNQMRRRFSPETWHFLTGSAENTRAVADSAGFKFIQQSDQFIHPGAIILLTREGTVSRYLYGTSFLPAEVTMAVQEAAKGQVRPTISKVLSFCYTYDPEGRKYVFSVTRFAGAAILILAAVFVVFALRGKQKRDSGL